MPLNKLAETVTYPRPVSLLEVFVNDSIHRILHIRRRDCVPAMEQRHHLCLTSIPALFVQRRLRWFGYAVRRPESELIKGLLLPTPHRTWHRRTGGQLKTWAATIKADLELLSGPRIFGHARWRKGWVKVCLVSSHRTVERSGRIPTQVQVSKELGGGSKHLVPICLDLILYQLFLLFRRAVIQNR